MKGLAFLIRTLGARESREEKSLGEVGEGGFIPVREPCSGSRTQQRERGIHPFTPFFDPCPWATPSLDGLSTTHSPGQSKKSSFCLCVRVSRERASSQCSPPEARRSGSGQTLFAGARQANRARRCSQE